MYAVIFKAVFNELDDDYYKTAERLRELAPFKYKCTEFTAATEGNHEIVVSYWESTEQIKAWKI